MVNDSVKAEMHQAVVEVGTGICKDVTQAYHEIATLRKVVGEVAGTLGLKIGASGTHPVFALEQTIDYTQSAVR
jgi:carboxylate-amine ligase